MIEVHVDLYLEHLEEASFLFDQRLHLLADNDMPWSNIQAFEDRLEAHIDALMVGGVLALGVCEQRAGEGDAGELYAATCVFCRSGVMGPVLNAIEALQGEDPASPRLRAFIEALKQDLPPAWVATFLDALETADGNRLSSLVQVIGYRRIDSKGALARAMARSSKATIPSYVRALGQTCEANAAARISEVLAREATEDLAGALIALVRADDPGAHDTLLHWSRHPEASFEISGLCGGRHAVKSLIPLLGQSSPPPGAIRALALLGDLAAVGPLIKCLGNEGVAGDAAEALHVVTGAPLYEDVFVAEEPADDEWVEGEEPKARASRLQASAVNLPTGDAGELGVRVRRLSRDPAVWTAWLDRHSARFEAGLLYRSGRRIDPNVLLACLSSSTYPKVYREQVVSELLLRFAIDLPLETDLWVHRQLAMIRKAAPRIEATSSAFEAGRRYLVGFPFD